MVIDLFSGSLKFKLYGFVMLAVFMIFSLLGAGIYYYSSIERAHVVKNDLNRIVKMLQDTRVAEKTYLQFHDEDVKSRFEALTGVTATAFESLNGMRTADVKESIASAVSIFKQYKEAFAALVSILQKHGELKAQMLEPLQQGLMLLNEIQGDLEAKQAELQMEGDELSSTEKEMMNVTRDCKIVFLELQTLQYQFLESGDKRFVEAFEAMANGRVTDVTTALNEFAIATGKKKYLENSESVQGTVQAFLRFIEQSQTYSDQERSLTKELDETGKKILDPIDMIVRSTNNLIDRQRKSALTTISVIVIFGIAAFMAMSYLIVKRTTNPLQQVVGSLKDIAEGEGDLTHRLVVESKDEMGELAKWFNTFIEKIQILIQEVARKAGRLQHSAKDLLEISEHMSSGAEQTSFKANTVSGAGEKMSENMSAVAGAMSDASNNVNMVASSIEEMTVTFSGISTNTEKARVITADAVAHTENASARINALGESAHDIGKVIETITEISEQVNLLALNATIEAARAGDAGKGFAVVANEIKALAAQTAEATNEIKKRIHSIQGSTQDAVSEIVNITKVVAAVDEIVDAIASAIEEQSGTTRDIVTNVTQVSQGLSEINGSVSQSSSVSTKIADEIAEVKIAAEEMSGSSQQVNHSSVSLSELAGALNELVCRFKI